MGGKQILNFITDFVKIALELDKAHRMRLEQGCRLCNGIGSNTDGTVAIVEQATPSREHSYLLVLAVG